MSSKEIYYLREFRNGDFMLWNVCSQCYNTFTVTLKDDKKTYATINKANHITDLQKLSQASAFYDGGSNLRVEVEFFDGTKDIQESVVSGGTLDPRGNTVGYSYTYCLEDGEDWDFNDAYITLTAWRKKG